MLKPKYLEVTFEGKESDVAYFTAQIGGTYKPITGRKNVWNFFDGGIS